MATVERQLQQNLNTIEIGQQAMVLSFFLIKNTVCTFLSVAQAT